MIKFPSSKNRILIGLLILLCSFLITVIFVLPPDERENQPPHYIFTIIIVLIIWILFDTKYTIKDKLLYYASGPTRGKIKIEKIKKIEHHSGWFVSIMVKPALNTKGLIIFYNNFDEIYISPKEEKEFLDELIRINPNIVVT